MKKLLTTFAALGMTATTGATAMTVVSCGDEKDSSDNNGSSGNGETAKYGDIKNGFTKTDLGEIEVVNDPMLGMDITSSVLVKIKKQEKFTLDGNDKEAWNVVDSLVGYELIDSGKITLDENSKDVTLTFSKEFYSYYEGSGRNYFTLGSNVKFTFTIKVVQG